jgi:sugar/nucleoside kinase (ribokinase family)
MQDNKIVISGIGCALADFLYSKVRFDSPVFSRYLSKEAGDGGLGPGKLVFTEEFEKFAGKPYAEVLKELTDNGSPDAFNIGGPGLVSMIHAAQMLEDEDFKAKFYGILGKDKTAQSIIDRVICSPLDISNFQKISERPTPFTDVFSDPTFDNGNGERTFVNSIGAAWDYFPDMIAESFFSSDIVCFGGTALVPQIHDNLTFLLRKARQNDCITVVNTVFDFRNEKARPGKPWPLGNNEDSYRLIDALILDHEEALKISGQQTLEKAIVFFTRKQVASFIITDGARDVTVFSDGRFFEKTGPVKYPVSRRVTEALRKKGDTTGCGDNFAGGIIASLALQLRTRVRGQFSVTEALALAVASGGFACSYLGGTFIETYKGEKRLKIQDFLSDYMMQIRKT